MKNLIIIGAGGHGKSVAWVAYTTKKWNNIYFLDDKISNNRVKGIFADRVKFKDHDFFIGVGDNKLRKKLYLLLKQEGYSLPSIVSPLSDITSAKIGNGSIIMNRCFINVDTIIEEGVIVNNQVLIEHDCLISSFVHLSPSVNIAGSTKIGELSWIGIGSNIIQSLNITSNVIVGAGSTVIDSIKRSGTYVGAPARLVNKL
jgi:sugar O-acyltransferase (sialic acid O-acetyltransferase NeuD family)